MNCTECRSEGTQECIACLRGRLREVAQILIAEVGADGPTSAEEAARRMVDRFAAEQRHNVELQMGNRALQKQLEGLEFALATGRPVPIPEGQPPISGCPEIGAPDLAPLLLRGDTVIVIRMPPIDLPPREYTALMQKVRTDTLAWLAQERVHHSGVLILAPGWELSAVPREQLRDLLDGDPAERLARVEDRLEQTCAMYGTLEGKTREAWQQFYHDEAVALLAEADGAHVPVQRMLSGEQVEFEDQRFLAETLGSAGGEHDNG